MHPKIWGKPTLSVNKIVNLGIDGLINGATAPTVTKLGNWYGYAFGKSDDGFIRPFEIPYDWDGATDITVKIHWYINEAYATHSGEVRWNINYSCCPETGQAVDSSTHGGTIDFADINIPATAKHLVETTGVLPVANLSVDDVIAMNVTRVNLVGGSDPTAEPVIVGIEIEFVSTKHGEAR